MHGPIAAPGVVPKLSGTPGAIRQAARWTVGRRHGGGAGRAGRGRRGARAAARGRRDLTREERAWRTGWAWTWAAPSPTCSWSTTATTGSGASRRRRRPADPSEGVLAGRAAHLRRGGHRAGRAGQRRPRHDRRHQRRARVQGRARRPDHHARASARSCTSPARRRPGRWPAGSSWSSPTRRPRWPTRARRSSGWTRAARRSSPSTATRSPGSSRELVDAGVESLTVSLINAYVDGRHEREIAGDRRGAVPGLPRHDLLRRAARVPRVRADADRVHELLRAPAGGRLRGPAAVGAAAASACAPSSTSCARTPA